MKNIISNGHCVVGSVKKVLRQKRIVTFSKYHAMEEARCYRIVAEADDMWGVRTTYVSDMISYSASRGIPEKVKIYLYGQENCFVWQKTSRNIGYLTEDSIKVAHDSHPRKWLCLMNRVLWFFSLRM